MIIVSQDKEKMVNFDNIEILGIDSDNKLEIVCDFNEGNMVLGTYKTEGRAKEVLNEIILGTTIKQINQKKLTEKEFYMIVKCMEFNLYEMPLE